MTPAERDRRVRELFDRALDLPPDERAGFVERESAGDAALAAEVFRLLTHDELAEAEGMLEPPADESADPGVWRPPRGYHICCPHCRNPIEIVPPPADLDVVCPSCGSSFRVADDSPATHAAEGDPSSRTFDRFELIAPLGVGAFGTVWKARDPKLDRTVALKLPRAGNLGTASEKERFLREARAAAQLRHPGIVPVHEVGEHDGQAYLVSELVSGVSLGDWLAANGPTFRQAAAWVAEVADALDHAHRQGVTHRDVKPSNMMLDETGRARLMDFGLAKRAAGEVTMTADGHVLGTPAYMAPEQVERPHAVDGRADVYSLGVVLYQLLTGELPFRGTQRMVLKQVLEDEPRPPRRLNGRVPKDLETVCLKAMAKEPRERYASAQDLAEDLRRWLEGRCVLARPTPRVHKAWRWCLRNRLLATVSGLAVAGLLGMMAASVLYAVAQSAAREREGGLKRQAEGARDDASVTASRLSLERGLELAGQGDPSRGLLYLADGLERLPRRPDSVSEVEYALRVSLGETFRGIHRLDCILQTADRPGRPVRLDSTLERSITPPRAYMLSGGQFVEGHVVSLAWHPKAHQLATGSVEGDVQVWDASTGSGAGSPFHAAGSWPQVRFNAEGTRLIVTSLLKAQEGRLRGKAAEVRDWVSGRQLGGLLRLAAPLLTNEPSDGDTLNHDAVLSPRGDRLLVWTTEGIRLVNLVDGTATALDPPLGESYPDYADARGWNWASFSPDGRQFLVIGTATAGLEHQLRIYESDGARLVTSAPVKPEVVYSHASYHPSGKSIIYIGMDGLSVFDSASLELRSGPTRLDFGDSRFGNAHWPPCVEYLPAADRLVVRIREHVVAVLRNVEGSRTELAPDVPRIQYTGRTPDGSGLLGLSPLGDLVLYDLAGLKTYRLDGVSKPRPGSALKKDDMVDARSLLSWGGPPGSDLRLFRFPMSAAEFEERQERSAVRDLYPRLSLSQVGQPFDCADFGAGYRLDRARVKLATLPSTGAVHVYSLNPGQIAGRLLPISDPVILGDRGVYVATPSGTAKEVVLRPVRGTRSQSDHTDNPGEGVRALVETSYGLEGSEAFLLGNRGTCLVGESVSPVPLLSQLPKQRLDFPTLSFEHGIYRVAPDGRSLVRRDREGQIHIHDPAPPFALRRTLPHPRHVFDCAFTLDSSRLVTACEDGLLRTWRLADGRLESSAGPLPEPYLLRGIRLSDDGRRLLLRYRREVRCVDASTLRPHGPTIPAHERIIDAYCVDSEKMLAVLDNAGRLGFWEVTTGLLVAGPIELKSLTSKVESSISIRPTSDGRALVVCCEGKAWTIPVPQPVEGDPQRIRLWVETVTGLELDGDRFARLLDPAAWFQRRSRLEAMGGPPSL